MTSGSRTAEEAANRSAAETPHDASPSDAELAQIERNLALSYAERLDQLVRTVAFIEAGRAALARRRE